MVTVPLTGTVPLIATVPLTDNEAWREMPAGTLWLFRDGAPVRQAATIAGPEKKPAAV